MPEKSCSLTTIIYRSHLRDDVPVKALSGHDANIKNNRADVTGDPVVNGTHFFQLLEGPEGSASRYSVQSDLSRYLCR